MHATQLFIDQSGVLHAHVECAPVMGTLDRKSTLFKLIAKFFSEGHCFRVLAWYCVYRVVLLCDKFWTCLDLKYSSSGWKCKKVSTVPHVPLYQLILKRLNLLYSGETLNVKEVYCRSLLLLLFYVKDSVGSKHFLQPHPRHHLHIGDDYKLNCSKLISVHYY